MRKVFRAEDNSAYWDRRWLEAGKDQDFADTSIYPIRYAEQVVGAEHQTILELGCGLGRIATHYHARGYSVVALDKSRLAVERLKSEMPEMKALISDARSLPFPNASFDVVLSFGVYHNIEEGVDQALSELFRILRPDGRYCVSMRPDNLEMQLNEALWHWRNPAARHAPLKFHKWLTKPKSFMALLLDNGLDVDETFYARNMSILYRLPFLRDRALAEGEETLRRSMGYRLNAFGRGLDAALRLVAPYQMCNVVVFTGHRRGPV